MIKKYFKNPISYWSVGRSSGLSLETCRSVNVIIIKKKHGLIKKKNKADAQVPNGFASPESQADK
jgi:hypothetical protein